MVPFKVQPLLDLALSNRCQIAFARRTQIGCSRVGVNNRHRGASDWCRCCQRCAQQCPKRRHPKHQRVRVACSSGDSVQKHATATVRAVATAIAMPLTLTKLTVDHS